MPSGSWNRDGVILVGGGGSIWRVPDTGGTPSPVVAPHGAEKRGGFFPFFLPDGRHFLYYGSTTELETGAVYVGSLDAKPETQGTKPLLTADTAAVFAPDPGQPAGSASGYLLFARDRTLLFQRFDAKRLQLVGEAVPITDQVGRYSILPSYSVSTNGVLIYYPGYAPTLMSQVTVVDRKGNVTGTLGEPVAWARGTAKASRVKFSPDGKRFALPIIDPGNSPPTADLWISDLRGFRTRLTFGPGSSYNPVWSPDGSRIAYRRSIGDNDGKMYWKAADGTGNEEPLAVTGLNPRPTSWSNDGRYLLYDVQGEGQNSYDIWVLPLKGDSKPFPFLRTPADEHEGAFSPNGRWVAYVSNETGSFEIFVRPFPPSNRGKWLVSKGMVGSTLPGWRKDGKELTYIDRDANMTSVTVTQDSVFQPGEPTPLFKVPSVMLGALPDRNAFLAGMPIGAAASTSKYLTVVLNWQSGLKK